MTVEARAPLHCSFCEKSQTEVKYLIAGKRAHICEECIELAIDIVDEQTELAKRVRLATITYPWDADGREVG